MPSSLADLKQAALINTLQSCQLFAGMPRDDLRDIAELSSLKSLENGAFLFNEGQPSVGFYIVQQGSIKLHRVNAAGKEQVIHVFRAGESFAEATLATEGGYPGDAQALESSQVVLVEKQGFIGLLKRRPELALRMLGSMSMHLRVLVGQLEDLTLKDVETRLTNWLVKRCPDRTSSQPVDIQLTMTKRVLAAELGTVSETFSRTLAKLRGRGLVRVDKKTITVVNPAELAGLLRRHLGE